MFSKQRGKDHDLVIWTQCVYMASWCPYQIISNIVKVWWPFLKYWLHYITSKSSHWPWQMTLCWSTAVVTQWYNPRLKSSVQAITTLSRDGFHEQCNKQSLNIPQPTDGYDTNLIHYRHMSTSPMWPLAPLRHILKPWQPSCLNVWGF